MPTTQELIDDARNAAQTEDPHAPYAYTPPPAAPSTAWDLAYQPNGAIAGWHGSGDLAGFNFADYNPVYNPVTMSQLPGYEKQVNANSGGFNKFRDFAMSKGPSSYANSATRAANLLAMSNKEHLAKSTMSQNALANSNLAAQGGLSSGARERVAETGQRSYIEGLQDTNRDNSLNLLNIGAQDQGQKLNALGALPGMENARVSGWSNARNMDLSNQMAEGNRINEYNMANISARNSALAAQKQAAAVERSGKKRFNLFDTSTW
jgi:hypothetical protein